MLTKIVLQNFRNYENRLFTFDKNVTIFVGKNAIGKTNILEAIYSLASGKAFRAVTEHEVVNENASVSSRVARVVGLTNQELELEILWDDRSRFQKIYKINGVGKRQIDFVGHLPCVLFQPEDLTIVIGSPSGRRRYLDDVLSQSHKDYRVAIHIYEKALRQRNRLLYRIKKEELRISDISDQLEYWNELLIDKGQIIHNFRRGFIVFLEEMEKDFLPLKIEYDHSIISHERLKKYHFEELASGTTLVGPHRDDVIIKFKNLRSKNFELLANYGSRGQQRLGVLALKMGELDYAQTQMGIRPILLLDDIFSELDVVNREHVFDLVSKQQTIMTTTDIHESERELLEKLDGREVHLGE